MLQKSVPAWFEIPSADLDRAVRFYEGILETRLVREDMGPLRMGVFPHEKAHPSGARPWRCSNRRSPTARASSRPARAAWCT